MSCWGLYVPEAYLSCQGGLSRLVGVYVYQKLTCPVRVVCHALLGFICTEAYLSCQGGLSHLVGVYMDQKLTCPVRVVCHVLMGFICTRSLPVLSGWSVTSCWGLYVPEAYLSCPGGLSCLVGFYMYRSLPVMVVCHGGLSGFEGVYMYQKLTCPVRVVCHALLGFICTEAYLSCQGGLSHLVGVYMYQKLTCPVRVVCHVLLGFICT